MTSIVEIINEGLSIGLLRMYYLYGLLKPPKNINDLIPLEKLSLFGCELTSLPDDLEKLTNLKELNVGTTKLTNIPEWIGQLNNLQKLNVENNRLTSLPDNIGQLKNLQYLKVGYNHLTNLPEIIAQLEKLQELDLSYNNLTSLPEGLIELILKKNIKVLIEENSLPRVTLNNQEYTALNPSYLYTGSRKLLDKTRIKPVNEILNKNNINDYLNACIERNWIVNPKIGMQVYKLITGEEVKDFEYYNKILDSYVKNYKVMKEKLIKHEPALNEISKRAYLKYLFKTTGGNGQHILDKRTEPELNELKQEILDRLAVEIGEYNINF